MMMTLQKDEAIKVIKAAYRDPVSYINSMELATYNAPVVIDIGACVIVATKSFPDMSYQLKGPEFDVDYWIGFF